MNKDREYVKFRDSLLQKNFTLKEVRKLLDNDFVTNITHVGPDPENKNFIKYLVTLVEGEVYTIYVIP